MSRRVTDSRGEKAVGIFLDKYFYSRAQEMRIMAYVERIYAKNQQIKGIDVILDEHINIDEKAQLYYINNPVDSFAFEIDYFDEKTNTIVDGWYINQSNVTDDYLLMWIPKARTKEIHRIVAEDFEIIIANLVAKKRIKTYIEKLGLNDKGLKKKAIEMRDKDIKRVSLDGHSHLTYSLNGYTEKPINLVIDKAILDEISERRFEISKEGIKIIK